MKAASYLKPKKKQVDPGFNKPTGQNKGQPKKKPNKLPYLDKNFDPLSPRTGKQAKRYINSAVRLETNPLKRQLGSELRASQDRENRIIPQWFQGYQDNLARWRGESQGAYDAATQKVADFSNQGGAQDAANRAGMEQRAIADAQSRGVAYDPSVFEGQANAESARHNVQTSTLGTLAGQGANQFGYLTNRAASASQAENEQRNNQNLKSRSIQSDQRALASEQGDLARKLMDEMTESERKFYLEGKALQGDKAAEKGRNWRARLSADTSVKTAGMSQKGQNKRQEDKQRFDKKQSYKDRLAAKKRARISAKGKGGKGKGL